MDIINHLVAAADLAGLSGRSRERHKATRWRRPYLHLSADAITKRLSDMSDAELAALEQRMIAAAPIVLEATAEASDDAELPDGDVADSPPDASA
jgi:hypothetical protein